MSKRVVTADGSGGRGTFIIKSVTTLPNSEYSRHFLPTLSPYKAFSSIASSSVPNLKFNKNINDHYNNSNNNSSLKKELELRMSQNVTGSRSNLSSESRSTFKHDHVVQQQLDNSNQISSSDQPKAHSVSNGLISKSSQYHANGKTSESAPHSNSNIHHQHHHQLDSQDRHQLHHKKPISQNHTNSHDSHQFEDLEDDTAPITSPVIESSPQNLQPIATAIITTHTHQESPLSSPSATAAATSAALPAAVMTHQDTFIFNDTNNNKRKDRKSQALRYLVDGLNTNHNHRQNDPNKRSLFRNQTFNHGGTSGDAPIVANAKDRNIQRSHTMKHHVSNSDQQKLYHSNADHSLGVNSEHSTHHKNDNQHQHPHHRNLRNGKDNSRISFVTSNEKTKAAIQNLNELVQEMHSQNNAGYLSRQYNNSPHLAVLSDEDSISSGDYAPFPISNNKISSQSPFSYNSKISFLLTSPSSKSKSMNFNNSSSLYSQGISSLSNKKLTGLGFTRYRPITPNLLDRLDKLKLSSRKKTQRWINQLQINPRLYNQAANKPPSNQGQSAGKDLGQNNVAESGDKNGVLGHQLEPAPPQHKTSNSVNIKCLKGEEDNDDNDDIDNVKISNNHSVTTVSERKPLKPLKRTESYDSTKTQTIISSFGTCTSNSKKKQYTTGFL